MQNFDAMKETDKTVRSIQSAGIFRSAIIAGFLGGAAGVLAWLCVQIAGLCVPLRRAQMQKYAGPAILAMVLPTVMTVSRNPDLDTSKIPILSTIVPPIPDASSAKQLRLFGSNEFVFTIQMPEPISMGHLDIAGVRFNNVTYEQKDGALVIGYGHIPDMLPDTTSKVPGSPSTAQLGMQQRPLFKVDINAALRNSVKQSIDNVHGTITYQTPITLKGGYPGIEAEGTIPNRKWIFRQRVYGTGNNFYQLAVYGESSFVNSTVAYKFLDSFNIR